MLQIKLTAEQLEQLKPVTKIAKRASKKGTPGGIMAQVHCIPGENHYGTIRVVFLPTNVADEIIAVHLLHKEEIFNANKGDK